MTSLPLYGVLGILITSSVLGVPIAISFTFAASVGLYFSLGGLEPTINLLQQSALTGVKDYNFAVIPLFTVMGMLIAYCGAAADLFNLVNRRLKGLPARLAIATVGGNAIFAAVTGVGIAAAAAFSHVAYPAMQKRGYDRSFATGCIAGSSVLGLLIPPSILMIVWAMLTEQSVGKLFAAGLIPGIVLATMYAAYCFAASKLNPTLAPDDGADLPEEEHTQSRQEFIGWFGVFALITVVLGGIWFGFFTPTEGAAFGLVGALILALAKGMRFEGIVRCFVEAGRTTTPILFLIIGAMIYTKLLALDGTPDVVKDVISNMGLGSGGSLLFMVCVWFVLGCMIDSISIMLLTVPVFWPIAQSFDMEPITFALIGILVIEAGILTPPFGLGCFVVKACVPDRQLTLREVFVGATPYWIMILILAGLIHIMPSLATWLPSQI